MEENIKVINIVKEGVDDMEVDSVKVISIAKQDTNVGESGSGEQALSH